MRLLLQSCFLTEKMIPMIQQRVNHCLLVNILGHVNIHFFVLSELQNNVCV